MGIAQCTPAALDCAEVIDCVKAQPTGTPAVAGDLVFGGDGQFHALPAAAPFATPAETIAGTSTTTIINPADLTAKLANQPAAGACTDREDVVWNGTILQGAAKHYNLVGQFPGIADTTTVYPGGTIPAAPAGAVTTVTNPSSCRPAILEITGWNQVAAPAGYNGTFNTVVFVDGVALSGAQNEANISGISGHTGQWERESGASVYVTIPAGGSVNIGFALRSSGAVTILFGLSAHVYKYHLTTI